MDPLTLAVGLVVALMMPQAWRDLKRMARALRLYTSITGAVYKDQE